MGRERDAIDRVLAEYVRLRKAAALCRHWGGQYAAKLDADLRQSLDATMAALGAIKTVGEAGTSYDQLLASGNAAGDALLMNAIAALIAQTRSIERAVSALNLDAIAFEGSDSLDNPDAVFQ